MKRLYLLLILPALLLFGTVARACYTVTETGEFYDVVITNATMGDGSPLSTGDEIAVKDGDLVVGYRAFAGTFPLRIAAWRADSLHALAGYHDGDPIHFEVCRTPSHTTLSGEPTWETGGAYGDSTYSVASLVLFGPTSPCYTITETGDFYDVVIGAAYFNGVSLNVGDEIAVKDVNTVVGSRVYEGTYPLRIAAWRGDPVHGLTGYHDGDLIWVEVCTAGSHDKVNSLPVTWTEGGHFGDGTLSDAPVVFFGLGTPVQTSTWGKLKSRYR